MSDAHTLDSTRHVGGEAGLFAELCQAQQRIRELETEVASLKAELSRLWQDREPSQGG